ncbi:MAG: hypothetical protein U9N84_09585 [Actinomycetota bacterium]|nr:hypothetical protein [Actinomycetota bacterium]
MIRRIWRVLPGPTAVRVVQATILTVLFLIVLNSFYDWLGTVLIDQGGTVG